MSNHIMDLKTASLIAIIVTFSPRVEGFNCSDWDKEIILSTSLNWEPALEQLCMSGLYSDKP